MHRVDCARPCNYSNYNSLPAVRWPWYISPFRVWKVLARGKPQGPASSLLVSVISSRIFTMARNLLHLSVQLGVGLGSN